MMKAKSNTLEKAPKIIVTGGLGYIGSHTCVLLGDAGYQCVIVDDLSNSTPRTLDLIRSLTSAPMGLEVVDLKDRTLTANILSKHSDAEAAIHFAAHKAVGESMKVPLKYYENNVGGLMNLLHAMGQNGLSNIIFSSSCAVYGEQSALPVTEMSPRLKATSPYGRTKQICEDILEDTLHGEFSRLKAISLRYFNPIGSHPSGQLGEMGKGVPENLLPYVMETATGVRDHLRIWGDQYDTPDGTPVRDYVHVLDIAEAHVLALNRMIKGSMRERYEIFNLGSGQGYSVWEIVKAVERVIQSTIPTQVYNARPGDIAAIYAQALKAKEILNWSPNYSLDDMVRHAWTWEQNGKKNLLAQ